MPPTKKQSSHFSAGLLAGALVGVAAGFLIHTKEGKQLTKELQAKTKKFQAKLLSQLKSTKNLSKERYTEIVDQLMDYFLASKEVAESEVPAIRKFLLQKWSAIQKQLEALK